MKKKVNIFSKHKYMFSFAIMILASQYIGNFEKVYYPFDATFMYHVADFRLGYLSRVLPGEIFQWFFPNPTLQNIRNFELVLFIIVALCASYFLELLYFSAKEDNKHIYLYLIVIFCISGCTFNMFYRQLGMLDVYWIYALVFFLIVLQNKKTWFLTPLSFAFMVAVHYGALLSYIPLMAIIILYKAAVSEEKSDKKYLIIVFFTSVVVTVGMFVFFTYNEKYHMNYTLEELVKYLDERGNGQFNYYYYDYAYFRDYTITLPTLQIRIEDYQLITSDAVPDYLKTVINYIAWNVYVSFAYYKQAPELFKDNFPMIPILLISVAPVLIYIYRYFRKLYRLSEDKLKRFCLFCAMSLFPFTVLSSLVGTYDYARWISHAFICFYVCFFVILKTEGERYSLPSEPLNNKGKILFLLYAVMCFLARFNPYRMMTQ